MKRKILFVDDEPKVLDGLRRMLREMRNEWDMVFVTGGQEALDTLATSSFDAVVSDMCMPHIDGAQLLTEVMKLYPDTVRIILSGQSEKEMILKSVGPTHQYLAKPCDAETLKNTISRACATHYLLSNEAIKQIVSQMDSLPSLPSLYHEITSELESPNASMKKVGDIISEDLGMTAKILQLVNSAFFGLPQHVSSPAQAAILLGVDTIRALVLSVHIFSEIDSDCLKNFNLDRLSQHSLKAGIFAREIAKAQRCNQKEIDHAFISGLLHDIGKLLLVTKLPEEYQHVLSVAENTQQNLAAIENRLLGSTHAEIGGYLVDLWGFTDPIVEAIYFHHTPADDPETDFTPLTAVHVANSIDAEGCASEGIGIVSQIDHNYIEKIGMTNRLSIWKDICHKINEHGEQHVRESAHSR